ncbi:hypothetical protein D3C71_778300 [compost metagenome]
MYLINGPSFFSEFKKNNNLAQTSFHMNRLIYFTIFILLCAPAMYAQVSPAIKITAAIRNEGSCFGNSVSIDASYAVVGVSKPWYLGDDPGSAIIFERDAGGSWNQIQILTPSDIQPGDHFGTFTAISGNYIVVSAPFADSIGQDSTLINAGAVYVFERNSGGVWQQVIKIRASDAHSYDIFGHVALHGKYLVVGSYNDYDANEMNYKDAAGAVYVFERTDGGEWLPVQKLTASDRASGNLFNQVAVDGYTKTIVVGAPGVVGANPAPQSGAAYVFKRDASGNWNETQKLTSSAPIHTALFGSSVDINGSWILIGASHDYYTENDVWNGNNQKGAAYLFEDNGAGSWIQKRKICAHDGYASDEFGRSVSLDGNYAVIGSEGMADENHQNLLSESGSAYLYERNGSTWSLKKKLVAPDRSYYDQFGWSVSISGAQVMIGAIDEGPENQYGGYLAEYGSAYIFNILNPLGMEESDLNSVNVYPNPTDGNLTISGEELFTELLLMDVTGKILNQTSLSPSGMVSYSIDQPEGVYFLKITAGKSSVIKKILVR